MSRLSLSIKAVLLCLCLQGQAVAQSVSTNALVQLDAYANSQFESSEIDLRRARLGISGKLDETVSFVAGAELANGRVDWENVFLSWQPRPRLALFAGHIEAPLSFEDETSDASALFLERAALNGLTFGRSLGVGARWVDDHWRLETSLTGEPRNNAAFGRAKSLRSAIRIDAFDLDDQGGWFIGGAIGRDDPNRRITSALSTGPELRGLQDQGAGPTVAFDDSHYRGVEAFWQTGSVLFAAEHARRYYDLGERRIATRRSSYVEGAWLITGERHDYDVVEGRLTNVTPDRRFGALEVAARYSESRMDAVTRSRQDSVTFGLNWYLRGGDRLMANVIRRNGGSRYPARTGFGVRWQKAFVFR